MKMRLPMVLVIAALGCSKAQGGGDCKTLVQTAGPLHATFAEVFGRSDQPPEALEKEAAAFDKGAADLVALDVKDDGVKAIATEYAAVLTKAAKIRRDMASSAGALDPTAAAKSQAAATQLAVEETQVKAKMNTTCN